MSTALAWRDVRYRAAKPAANRPLAHRQSPTEKRAPSEKSSYLHKAQSQELSTTIDPTASMGQRPAIDQNMAGTTGNAAPMQRAPQR